MKRIARGIVTGVIILAFTTVVSACPECRLEVEGGIYDENFSVNLFIMLLPILVLISTGIGLYHADEIAKKPEREYISGKRKKA